MDCRIAEEPVTQLDSYGEIPIKFEVQSVFEIDGDDPNTATLVEKPLVQPWIKDYDMFERDGPMHWSRRWDISNWGMLAATDFTLWEETETMTEHQFIRAITVLPVKDIAESTRWYEDSLGLRTCYLHEGSTEDEATNYAILARDGLEVHLVLDEPPPYGTSWTKAGTGYLYLKVQDIDSMYEEVCSRHVPVAGPLQTENWGARGFNLTDPSGNSIHIEQE